MPFLRVLRDRRGIEHTYLMDLVRNRGRQRSRILYVFRTPPGVRVGREPLDPDTRRLIEEANPGVEFDWNALLTSVPPPEPETAAPRPVRRPRRPGKPAAPASAPASAPEQATPLAPVPEPLHVASAPVAARERTVDTKSGGDVDERELDEGRGAREAERGPQFPTAIEGETVGSRVAWLRVCHAETVARIEQEIGDEPRRTELLRTAERLNPTAWETAGAIETGIADATEALGELATVFSPPPRRRRRGGHASEGASASRSDSDEE